MNKKDFPLRLTVMPETDKVAELYLSPIMTILVAQLILNTTDVHDAVKSDSICTDENINWKWYNDDEKEKLYLFLNEQIILKRYYCTLDDLDKMDWTITNP